MNRPPFITLAFIAVMLQVMTFGACRPRPTVEVFLPSGVVASLDDHHHPHAGEHTHAHLSDHSHAERDRPDAERSGACDGHPPESPGHVHLWDIGPIAPRPDRDADAAPPQPTPALGTLWLPADLGEPRSLRARFLAPTAGAPPGLRTTRLLI